MPAATHARVRLDDAALVLEQIRDARHDLRRLAGAEPGTATSERLAGLARDLAHAEENLAAMFAATALEAAGAALAIRRQTRALAQAADRDASVTAAP